MGVRGPQRGGLRRGGAAMTDALALTPVPAAPPEEIVAYSREMTEKGSKSFAVAARLLEPCVRDQAYMLYAWCRHADDEIDGQVLGFGVREDARSPLERLEALRAKTVLALQGEASEPPFMALAHVAAANAIPARHPLELIEGFEMDVSGRRYRTLDETLSYCYHVAGVVGVMMAMVMGVRAKETLNRASDLGIAFQLTNIARDVMDDAAQGRVYLPEDWLREAGVPPADIARPEHRRAVAAVTARLLAEAEHYYASARAGLADLPYRSSLAIATARQVYREIGISVMKRGEEAWTTRTIVSPARKAWCVAMAAVTATQARSLKRWRKAASREGLWTHPSLGV